MTALALDPGLRLGWCRSDGTNGVLDLSVYTDRGAATFAVQCWLADQFSQPTRVVYLERPFFVRMHAMAEFTYWLIGAIHASASAYDIPRHEEKADDVRKALIGRCRRKKLESDAAFDRVILAAVQEHGFNPTSEHAADAAALLIVCEGLQRRVAA